MPREFAIWLVDDAPSNIRMMDRSFPSDVREAAEIRAFLDEDEFLAEFEARAALLSEADAEPETAPAAAPDAALSVALATAPALPDFILLDFYLKRLLGAQVLTRILRVCTMAGLAPPVVIAHSSSSEGNRQMLRLGADFALPKKRGRDSSPEIAACFRSIEALRWMKENRAPMPA